MSRSFVPLEVLAVKAETPDAFTVTFRKPADDDRFRYLPGQYLTLKVDVNGEDCRRAYSLSSCPTVDDHLSVTIKQLEGGRVSNHLRNHLHAGDTLPVMPPNGNFVCKLDAQAQKHYVLVGGGSGITPLMSILKAVLEGEPGSRVTLLYANRDQDHIIFHEELQALERAHGDRFTVVHTLSQPLPGWNGPTGRLEGRHAFDLIAPLVKDSQRKVVFYVCGPNGMMDNVQDTLDILSVPSSVVHREHFSAPVPTAEDEAGGEDDEVYELVTQTVTVRLDGVDHQVVVDPESTILSSAIAADIDPPYACQEGVCTTCRAKLISGLVSMDEREGLSDAELEQGYILTCTSHPLSDDVVVEFG